MAFCCVCELSFFVSSVFPLLLSVYISCPFLEKNIIHRFRSVTDMSTIVLYSGIVIEALFLSKRCFN